MPRPTEETPSSPPQRTLDREGEADRDLRHTGIARGTAAGLVLLFMGVILAVPLWQTIADIQSNRELRRMAPPLERGKISLRPQAAEVFDLLPRRAALGGLRHIRGPRSVVKYAGALFPSTMAIRAYETRLEDHSLLTKYVLPPAQWIETRYFHTGNHKVYCGRSGWLFYQFDVGQATAASFLKENPNPADAIVDVDRQFAKRGIKLVFAPMVSKPTLYPDRLSFRYGRGDFPASNPGYQEFLDRLRGSGVLVFDTVAVASDLRRHSPGDAPLFQATDTHWRPELAAKMGDALAAFVKENVPLPQQPPFVCQRQPFTGQLLPGDMVRMLNLPATQTLYAPQNATFSQIRMPDGQLWKPDSHADVLVLGDSFTDVFSANQSGLAENFSAALGRRIDRLAKPGGGMTNLQAKLAEAFGNDPERLRCKRLVVWEFVVRDLYAADWGITDLKLPDRPSSLAKRPV